MGESLPETCWADHWRSIKLLLLHLVGFYFTLPNIFAFCFRVILTISSDLSPHSMNQVAFVKQKKCVYCEVGNKILYKICRHFELNSHWLQQRQRAVRCGCAAVERQSNVQHSLEIPLPSEAALPQLLHRRVFCGFLEPSSETAAGHFDTCNWK